jgi:hypothetical protein
MSRPTLSDLRRDFSTNSAATSGSRRPRCVGARARRVLLVQSRARYGAACRGRAGGTEVARGQVPQIPEGIVVTTITPDELVERARRNSVVRIDTRLALSFLRDWEAPWASGIELEEASA